MTELRELTDAELDIVGGGAAMPIVIKLVDEIIVDLLQLLEPKQSGRPMPATMV